MLSRFTQAKRQHHARQQQRSSKFQTTKSTSQRNNICVDKYQLGNHSLDDGAFNDADHNPSVQRDRRRFPQNSKSFHVAMVSNINHNNADVRYQATTIDHDNEDARAALSLVSMLRDRNIERPSSFNSLQGSHETRTMPSQSSFYQASTRSFPSSNTSTPTLAESSKMISLKQEKGLTKSKTSTVPCKSPTTEISAFYGSFSLYTPGDVNTLSPVHCFIRKAGIEAFVLTEEQAADKKFWNGRNFNVRPGFVGMRCLYCKHVPFAERYQKSVHYPSSTACIYYSMENWQRSHLQGCQYIPSWVPEELSRLVLESKNTAGGRRDYWSSSAKELGMEDVCTPRVGVIMKSDPRQNTKLFELPNLSRVPHDHSIKKARIELVQPEDEVNVSSYLFLLLSQMEYCTFSEEDRSGSRSKIKNIKIGFPGIQCKHCRGTAGVGRYFPATPHALALANSDRNIQNHLNKCRRCPQKVREDLLKAKRTQNAKVLRGTRKTFFYKIWERLHEQSNALSSSSTMSSLSCDSEEGTQMGQSANMPMEISIFRHIANVHSSANTHLFQTAHLSLNGSNRATASAPMRFTPERYLYETDSQINMKATVTSGTAVMHAHSLKPVAATKMTTSSYNTTAATYMPSNFKQDPSNTSCAFVGKLASDASADTSISTASSILYAFSQNSSKGKNAPQASSTLKVFNQNPPTKSNISSANGTLYASNENSFSHYQPTSKIAKGFLREPSKMHDEPFVDSI